MRLQADFRKLSIFNLALVMDTKCHPMTHLQAKTSFNLNSAGNTVPGNPVLLLGNKNYCGAQNT